MHAIEPDDAIAGLPEAAAQGLTQPPGGAGDESDLGHR